MDGDVVDNALVDDEMYADVSRFKWHKTHYGYAKRSSNSPDESDPSLWMHLYVYHKLRGQVTKDHLDHKDRNRLNNQIENLREATTLENNLNRGLSDRNKTGYLGVRRDERNGRYQVVTSHDNHLVSICYMADLRDAGIARDIYMKERHPVEFLVLNVPDATPEDIERVTELMNRPKQRRGGSKYLGVSFESRRGHWITHIKVNYKSHYVGSFHDERDAALGYDYFARHLTPDARINFPDASQEDRCRVRNLILSKRSLPLPFQDQPL